MALRRIFIDEMQAGAASVVGARAHHLSRVARLERGERVEISDRRRVFLAEVILLSSKRVDFQLLEEIQVAAPVQAVTLGLALIRYTRWEWAIEKATELGVARIVPVAAERGDAALAAAAGKRIERWWRIAEEAAQQSRRLAEPEVAQPLSTSAFLRNYGGERCFFIDVGGDPVADLLFSRGLLKGCNEASVLVGPEGGWSDAERAQAAGAGCQMAGLGDLILRSETAAVAALALLSQLHP